MPVGHLVPEIVLVAGAVTTLLAVLAVPRRLQWIGAPLALATLATSAWFAVDLASDAAQQITFFGTWAIDGATTWARGVVLLATAVVVVMSPEWFARDPRHGEYYPLLVLSALGATLVAGAADTMQLVIGVLLSSVTGYTLAGYHRRSALSVEAAMKYFLVGALANTLLTLGVVLLFGMVGSTLYEATAAGLAGRATDPIAAVAAAAAVGVGLAFKLGAVPAHAWLPDIAQGAPAPSAALLTVVPKVGGLVALARFVQLLPVEQVGWRPWAALVAAATMTLGNLAALWQDDLRRLLGWSSVSQSGYAIMAVVALGRSDLAVPALLYFLLAYVLANLAAFAVVTELRGRTALDAYAGLARRRPLLAAVLVVSFLSLVGIPPLAGFAGKLALFGAVIEGGYAWLAGVAVANTVVSLFYYLRVLGPLYFEVRREPVPVLGRWAGTAAGVTAVAVVAVGVVAEPAFDALSDVLLLPH
ncbi:MAG TPA: NADH-quinone oxidoreductase subunit N [Nitriliruptorales bacterium]|nr:NADH-quinone oxidoreductase subunit N [Nitriliruptorales bacterium]